MAKKESALTEEMILNEIAEFRQQQKTLILATRSSDHSETVQPLASYAPFIEDADGNFYLFLSGLAQHSANITSHKDEHSQLSVLLIEDEQSSRNLFARKRLTYSCTVTVWPRTHPKWQTTIDKLQERFGKTIEVLSSLGDFNLYCLMPTEGNYVRGFGQAYELKDARHPVLRSK
jgi:putative heme iron utilization protein